MPPDQQTNTLAWTSADKRVVLAQLAFDPKEGAAHPDENDTARMRALLYLKTRSARSGVTLIVTNPDVDEIDSVYGSCLGVDVMSYAWQSSACAEPVREHFRADYALFLSSQIAYGKPAASSSLSLIDLRDGKIVWSKKSGDGDWKDDRSAQRTIEGLLLGAPL